MPNADSKNAEKIPVIAQILVQVGTGDLGSGLG
jgi:hypothetical protein